MNHDDKPASGLPHEDPISGASDQNSLGTGIGVLGGATAGTALGSSLGPVGAVIGAVLGAGFGAVVGKGIAEGTDPDDDLFWQSRFRDEPYDEGDHEFDAYGPAYQLGRRAYVPHTSFEAAEEALRRKWENGIGLSTLNWSQVRHAVQASWNRAEQAYSSKD